MCVGNARNRQECDRSNVGRFGPREDFKISGVSRQCIDDDTPIGVVVGIRRPWGMCGWMGNDCDDGGLCRWACCVCSIPCGDERKILGCQSSAAGDDSWRDFIRNGADAEIYNGCWHYSCHFYNNGLSGNTYAIVLVFHA